MHVNARTQGQTLIFACASGNTKLGRVGKVVILMQVRGAVCTLHCCHF